MVMEEIIPKIERSLLLNELTEKTFVRKTNFGKNLIHIVDHRNAPNVMLELGRLREIAFRDAGGGTGKSTDIDSYDLGDNPFLQLLVWNPEDQEIVGGYRFIHCKFLERDETGIVKTPTSKLFWYSEKFIQDYLPFTIELGRSFVQPEYQPMKNLRKGMYSLDNLWDGLGALISLNEDAKYFFGKFTMYNKADLLAREAILFFLEKFFPDPDELVRPHKPLPFQTDLAFFGNLFSGTNYDENYKILQQFVRKQNESIPPLVNAYTNLSSTMKTFGTSANESFGEVEETGILITIPDIFSKKRDRHLNENLKL
jgi:hypothetical protein